MGTKNKNKYVEKICINCGKPYIGSQQSKFCGKECRNSTQAQRERRRRHDAVEVIMETLTLEQIQQEKLKNMTYAERQKANTLAMLGKIGVES